MSADIHAERILVLDFGSQYTQLIARRVREAGCYCEIYAYDAGEEAIAAFAADGIILSGGPQSATDEFHPAVPAAALTGVPVLGICYGLQALAKHFGAPVHSDQRREYGLAHLTTLQSHPLLDALGDSEVWMSHGDHVDSCPDGFTVIAQTADTPIAAIAHVSQPWFGLQFHPEVTHTPGGAALLQTFVRDICQTQGLWSPASIIEEQVAALREQVGSDGVVLALSGGVDSAVAAALLGRAIGEQLHCVFVDNGLLRAGEADTVLATLTEQFGAQVRRVDAAERFLGALAGVTDPEEKRRVIGREFIHVFQEEAERLPNIQWLGQGTIYPDVIESAASSGKSHLIKSHHNVGGLPETLHLKLVEPLRELFKDEVRRVGTELGLPADLIGRHPFPGPGLGVRVLGEVRAEYVALLRAADKIFIDELRAAGWYDKVAQAFVVFLPVRAVGVMGDGRRYDYVVSLRAVQTQDFMTAHWARLPDELLDVVARRIMNEIPGIARVCYDISSKPPATVEWE